MRKYVTITAICIAVVTATWFAACKDKKSTTTTGSNEDSLKKVIARGDYLANNVANCMDCHSKWDTAKYSWPIIPGTEGQGGNVFDESLGLPGKIYAKNITPDPETGIGTWTDEEILRALTQGINKKGDTLFPIMPYPHFNRVAKDDLLAIIAYLRSLKPIKNTIPARQLMMPIAAAYPGQFLQPNVDGNVRPPENDPVKYGEYLVTLADCGTCHSPLTPQGPDMTRMFAGGYTFNLPTNKVTSANITPDSATGIGTWTEERFLNKFTMYREEKNYNFNPGKQHTIMPVAAYAGMTDNDLKAIYAYLRTVKPIKNLVEKFPK